MNKKTIYLILAVVILAVLAVIYAAGTKKSVDNVSEEETEADSKIEIIKSDNISQISIKNSSGSYVIALNDDEYKITGYENNSFSQASLKQIFNFMSEIDAERLVEENTADISKFGLDNPTASAQVKGDSEFTFNLGNVTADGKYRYISINDNNSVYLMKKNSAEIVNQSINDLIDKSFSTISAGNVSYVDIRQNNKPEILITADEESSILQSYVSTSGLSALIMKSPIEDAIVYPTNMREFLLSDLSEMSIADIAELKPDDISKYGLDNPDMEIMLKDESDNTLSFKVGNSSDDDSVYVLINDRPEIYIMTKDNFNAFENANILDFIQNFVSLHARSTVDSVTISSDSYNHNIELKAEGDNKISVDEEGVKRDNRNDYINGKLIDKDTFGDFYEQLAGIGFDSVEYDSDKNADKPNLTITYNLSDGSTDTANYYNYDDNFYFIKKDKNIMLVNKQQIVQLIEKIDELSK